MLPFQADPTVIVPAIEWIQSTPEVELAKYVPAASTLKAVTKRLMGKVQNIMQEQLNRLS